MSILSKRSSETIAVVSNLTSGGAVVYLNELTSELQKKYKVVFHSPKPFVAHSKHKLSRLFEYIKYVYVYLPGYYNYLARHINRVKYKKTIVFQDSYIKTPNIFRQLLVKYVFVFHEPPREFYENMLLHTESIKDILFNLLFRLPVYFIDRNNMNYAKNIVSNSNFSKSVLYKIYKKESTVVYPGFKSPKPTPKPIRKNKCISVGSLLPYKGHHLVIEAIGKIRVNKPTLTVVGQGSASRKRYLLLLAKKNNVSLKIISKLSDGQLRREYYESFTYVNGAQNEPFGLTCLEAIGSGCNLVTNNTGGTKELLTFFKGKVFVSKNNSTDMSKSIIESFGSKQQSIADMGVFSWKNIAEKIEQL